MGLMGGGAQAYAMTEASHQMTSNPLPKNGPHKAGTVGRAQGSVQVTILDEQNKPLPVGRIGEVCIRGPNVTKGYLNNPKANEEAYAGQSIAPCHPLLFDSLITCCCPCASTGGRGSRAHH